MNFRQTVRAIFNPRVLSSRRNRQTQLGWNNEAVGDGEFGKNNCESVKEPFHAQATKRQHH